MTKTELTKLFAEACEIPATHAKEYIDRLGDIMAAELLAGGEVPLPSVGKLVVKKSAARAGRNPKTGESIQIPARKKVVLNMGKDLKESLQ